MRMVNGCPGRAMGNHKEWLIMDGANRVPAATVVAVVGANVVAIEAEVVGVVVMALVQIRRPIVAIIPLIVLDAIALAARSGQEHH